MQFTYRTKTFDIQGVSQEDHIYKTISETLCFYEKDLLEYIYTVVGTQPPQTLAVDVGANIGNHSIFFASFLTDHLIAIEPNPQVLPVLNKNLSHNIQNYQIYECAVGEATGTGTLMMPEDITDNAGMAKVVFDNPGDSIPVSTIDHLVDQWQAQRDGHCAISFIKLDVEGMELAALKGAQKTIARYKPHIFAEAATLTEYRELNNFLGGIGYKTLSKWTATPVYHFAYKPSPAVIARVYKAKALKALRRLNRSIKKRINRLLPTRQ